MFSRMKQWRKKQRGVGCAKTMSDVIKTELKRSTTARRQHAHDHLLQMEEGFRRLVDQSPDPVLICLDGGTIVYVNQEALDLLGASGCEQLIGRHACEFYHPDHREHALEHFRKVETGQNIGLVEGKVIGLDGRMKEIELKGTLTSYNRRPAIHVLVRDITEQKATQQLLRNQEKLSLAGQLAAGIAHEIRNPLTSLKGFLQLMQAHGTGKREYFQIMSSELNRIEGIVGEMLSLAKPASVQFKESDLVELLKHVVTLLETKAILNNVVIKAAYEVKTAVIHCDENQLKQAFINFIKNGIEAMPDGGEIFIHLCAPEDTSYRIVFSDQGCGIPEAQLEKLGEPFFTTKHFGTGLGFMMSEKIIRQHQGSIRIESQLNKGTKILVELPIS
ncbi:PAS domain S-box protein [Brevibacillus fluminis]|uniref:histidine kinase n=2 Tax=Brevibacillus fluminis TaxID=511487 RepID=A0A3M8DNC1_9BACL|nr:PAS domain S-box protein [Brevibacillus fluminis]